MTTTTKIEFSTLAQEEVRSILAQYPKDKSKSALIPLLHLAQAEFDGWLSPQVMDHVADILKIKPIEVYEVASFYTMFNLEPVGKYLIEVCHTSSCWLMGAEDIISYLERKLETQVGKITNDGMFQIKRVECLGSCGTAPMFQIGAQFYENLTFEKIDTILSELRIENKRSRYC
jgi:NADH-quinone oxidoreductase subunit E